MDTDPKKVDILALDLEGTLISNIVSQSPRPHLKEFLQFCQDSDFCTVLYTACDTHSARDALMRLERYGHIPRIMGMMPIVKWNKFTGPTRNPKNLQHAQKMYPGSRLHKCYLVDDISAFVAIGQQDQWIPVLPFNLPYSRDDTELLRVKSIIQAIMAGDNTVMRRGYSGDHIVVLGQQ